MIMTRTEEREFAAMVLRIAAKELTETNSYRKETKDTLSGILHILEEAQKPESGGSMNPFDELTETLLLMDEKASQRHEILVDSINALTISLNRMLDMANEG